MLSREIEYFLQVCEHRNIVRAADELGLSQPALTRAIQRLENQLGAQLFMRTPRGVEPTAIGEVLRKRSESARVILQDAEHEIAQMAVGKRGQVRIGVGPTVELHISQRLLPRLIHDRPGAQVMFHVAFSAELFKQVESGVLDFAVAGVPDSMPTGLVARILSHVEMCVVVREGHPILKVPHASITDLMAYRSAAPRQDVYARQIVEQALSRSGQNPHHVALESNSWSSILETVATTDLYTLAPWHRGFEEVWAERLRRINIPELHRQQTVGIVLRDGGYVSPLAERAIDLVSRAFS